jgi:hypothetical protein
VSVVGGNLTLALDERTHLGVTGYAAATEILLAPETRPQFAPASPLPGRTTFGAIGLDARTEVGPVVLSAEGTYLGPRAVAGYGRAIFGHKPLGETSLSLRYYGAKFENPFGRGEAAPDEVDGLRTRNEAGAHLVSTLTPARGLRLVTDLDLWRPIAHQYFDAYGTERWAALDSAPVNLRARERVAYSFTSSESASLLLEYGNKDLGSDSPTSAFDSAARTDCYTLADATDDCYATGQRRKAQLALTTTRVSGVRLSMMGGTDAKDNGKGGLTYTPAARATASVRAWKGGLLVVSVAHRETPALDSFVDLVQDLGRVQDFGPFTLRARYGLLHYDGERLGRQAWYQLAKLAVEGRF